MNEETIQPKNHFFRVFARSPLRNRLLAMVLSVSVLPLIIFGVLALYSINASHSYDIASIEESVLLQKKDEILRVVDDIKGVFTIDLNLRTRSFIMPESADCVSYSLQNGKEDLDGILFGILQYHASIEEVSLIDRDTGREIALMSRTQTGDLSILLPDCPDEKRGYRLSNFKDLSGLEKFKKARTGTVYLSDVYFTESGPMMTIAAPVFGKAYDGGRAVIVAVISGEINLSLLGRIISETHLGNTGFVYLVGHDGRLLASSEKRDGYYNLLASPVVYDVLRGNDRIGSGGMGYYDGTFKKEVLASGVSIPNLGWGVVAEWPRDDANSIVNIIQNQNILFSLVLVFVVIVMSLFLADRIIAPIRKLQEGTKRVAKGDFGVNLNLKTGDEIEDLGAAFNEMTKGLKEYQQLKDEFVFIAAHELRAPVTAIKGYLSMIEEGDAGELSPKMKEYLTPVSQSNKRLVNLVNDLLEVARQEAGRMTIDVAKIEPASAIESTIEELKPLAMEKNIAITYDKSSARAVLADEARMKEVMVNLLSNAIKYTVGSGTVLIWHETSGETLITHIKDTGIGMSKESQEKLFEKFYRVPDERTKKITGTGLGLFIIKQIIEKMNGLVWVVSEVDKGSTFSFSLPLAK